MSKLLASVHTMEEAEIALRAKCDIIDLKDPMSGALGGLPLSTIRSIVHFVGGRRPVSATIGDLPMEPITISNAIASVGDTGVDIVKVGFFGGGQQDACIQAISTQTSKHKVVAVLFGDREVDMALLEKLQSAGFYGVMLDTSDKNGKSLTDYLKPLALKQFVNRARTLGLFSGLAGALKVSHIKSMAALHPDYVGFRSALCHANNRRAALCENRIMEVRELLYKCNTVPEAPYLV